MTAQSQQPIRELHSRSGDGIDVRLLWCQLDGRLEVTVLNSRTGDGFAVEVREGDRAMDVFHHPYAYAAWRRIEASPTFDGFNPSELLAA